MRASILPEEGTESSRPAESVHFPGVVLVKGLRMYPLVLTPEPYSTYKSLRNSSAAHSTKSGRIRRGNCSFKKKSRISMCWCRGLLVACPPLPPPAEQTALSSDLRQTRRGGTAHRSPALQQLALGGELQNPERNLQGRGMDQSSRHIA